MESAKEMVQKIEDVCRKANQDLDGADPQEAETLLAVITHFAFDLERIVSEFLTQNDIKADISQMVQFAVLVQEMQIVLAEREYSKGIDELLEDLE